jgi:hypothetical protein
MIVNRLKIIGERDKTGGQYLNLKTPIVEKENEKGDDLVRSSP